MAANSASCRLSSFVLVVCYCFEMLLLAVHSFSAFCFWLGLLLVNFLALNADLFDYCMDYPQAFLWKWQKCWLVCCFIATFWMYPQHCEAQTHIVKCGIFVRVVLCWVWEVVMRGDCWFCCGQRKEMLWLVFGCGASCLAASLLYLSCLLLCL